MVRKFKVRHHVPGDTDHSVPGRGDALTKKYIGWTLEEDEKTSPMGLLFPGRRVIRLKTGGRQSFTFPLDILEEVKAAPAFTPGARVRAVRDTETMGTRKILKGEEFKVVLALSEALSIDPVSGEWPARGAHGTADDGPRTTARPEDFEEVRHYTPKSEPITMGGTHILTTHFRKGDVVTDVRPGSVTVDRQVPESAKPKPGFGTAYVFDASATLGEPQKRYRGFLTVTGNFYYLNDDGNQRKAWPDQFEGFQPEG